MNNVVFSHNSDNWATPKNIYNHFIVDLGLFDPFPLYSDSDNLNKIYNDKKGFYINPPFSKLKYIPNFIKNNLRIGCPIVLLMPARTDTIYFHELLEFTPSIYFIKGRLKFGDSTKVAPFPCILLVFRYLDFLPTWDYVYVKELESFEL